MNTGLPNQSYASSAGQSVFTDLLRNRFIYNITKNSHILKYFGSNFRQYQKNDALPIQHKVKGEVSYLNSTRVLGMLKTFNSLEELKRRGLAYKFLTSEKKMKNKKDKIIGLLIKKNEIMTRIAELYSKKGLFGMTEDEDKEHSILINKNSKLLKELVKLKPESFREEK